MAKQLPLNVTLDTIALKGFGVDQTSTGQSITYYDGGPLYCHADPDGQGGITITVDENAPSSFTQTSGPVKTVIVQYRAGVAGQTQTITWNTVAAGAVYDPANPLEHHLVMTNDLKHATLQITKPARGLSTANTLGLVVVGSQITGNLPEGYFVRIPMNMNPAVDPTEFSAISIAWGGAGGMAGPIGGGSIP
jgi:hypothetical protein